ncbi:MAG: amidohydrolase family protein [Clostridiales bacterium]|nr:amidohydrolase family protein [Clostridiales bacterium]
MIFDTHIHIGTYEKPNPKGMLESMDKAGVDKLALFADDPRFFEKDEGKLKEHNETRMAQMMVWYKEAPDRFVPIYYINPVEKTAMDQVDWALDKGAKGFKVICEDFKPGDPRAMPVYQHIADLDKAILFHSGILWDWGDNGNNNRPCNWECMFEIRNIRFALAHISWPWCDEAIALYGKFACMAYHPKYAGQKMYIDMTPGTPECYRQHVIDTLYQVNYEHMDERLLFGSDLYTDGFNAQDVADLAKSDTEKLLKAGFSRETCENIMGKNALRFWGLEG